MKTRSWKVIKAAVREMEEEAGKLKDLQNEAEKQMNGSRPPGSAEEKMRADAQSIHVAHVGSGAPHKSWKRTLVAVVLLSPYSVTDLAAVL